MSLIQVGTFLATIDFEEGKSMTDSHLPANKRTIMVVDDNPDLVDILRITLESKGFNVRCAYSGKDLFAGLEELKPDLIILDIMMPQMDGLKVLTRLRENSDTASIPVILLTAMVQQEDVIEGYKMGADYYITKPFTSTQVLEGINLILGGDQGRSVESL
jgi:DNA-binding response OmpR family regulator